MSSPLQGWADLKRRDFLKRSAVAVAVAAPAAGLLSSCATSGSDNTKKKASSGKKSDKNPLGVNATAPLNVFIFKGGYGDQYAKDALAIYAKSFPKAKTSESNGQQLAQKLQPAFVSGNPPDCIDNSGAGNLDVATLVAKGQIQDLSDMYKAPSYDTTGKTVEETLLPGVVEYGEFDGKPFILNYVYTTYPLWYSKTLFTQKGWEIPKTWDDMLTLSAKIKKAGVSPWTFQGKYPYYILSPILQMAIKNGGLDVVKALDNLEPNAWLNDSVVNAGAAFHELVAKGYILPGTPGLTHTQSQTYWAQGKAAFIPCGSWLENELGPITPKNFQMTAFPVPALSSSDKLPQPTVQASSGEGYIVPKQGKNPVGGMEFLRIMLSKQSSANFSKLVKAQTVVAGYADSLDVSSAFNSARDVAKASGDSTFTWNFGVWYAQMETGVENATGQLMAGKLDAKAWAKACQKAADATKKDSSIKKYHRA